jgi:uncharacterized protein (TIGR03437 family)
MEKSATFLQATSTFQATVRQLRESMPYESFMALGICWLFSGADKMARRQEPIDEFVRLEGSDAKQNRSFQGSVRERVSVKLSRREELWGGVLDNQLRGRSLACCVLIGACVTLLGQTTMSTIIRFAACLVCAYGLAPDAFAQCGVTPASGLGLNFSLSTDILSPDPSNFAAILLVGSCPGDPGGAHVRFTVSHVTGTPMIISPSSGVTPIEVIIGADPSYASQAGPANGGLNLVTFSTVDQSPETSFTVTVQSTYRSSGPPAISAVVDAASLRPQITPGGAVAITGVHLAPVDATQIASDGTYPLNLANTTVTFNGVSAPILSTSPSQIYVIVPQGLSDQNTAEVVVTHLTQTPNPEHSSPFAVPVTEQSLAIFPGPPGGTFPSPPNGFGPAAIFNCDDQGCSQNTLSNPAAAGSLITFFANVGNLWQRAASTNPGPSTATSTVQNSVPDGAVDLGIVVYAAAPVSLTIGGQPAALRYFGAAPYQPFGIFQVNAQVPFGLSPGAQQMALTIGQLNTAAQPVSVAVK